jgi:hypothetical protein
MDGDGDQHREVDGVTVQGQDILLLDLVEDMGLVLEPGPGPDLDMVMDLVVVVLMVVVMEVAQVIQVVEGMVVLMVVVMAIQVVEEMVLVEPIISHLRSLRIRLSMDN